MPRSCPAQLYLLLQGVPLPDCRAQLRFRDCLRCSCLLQVSRWHQARCGHAQPTADLLVRGGLCLLQGCSAACCLLLQFLLQGLQGECSRDGLSAAGRQGHSQEQGNESTCRCMWCIKP
jgi:hypothetical protein